MISDSKLLASAAWDAQSLNELKAKAGEDPAANIRPVARQVEGMFVQMMLKSMRDALPKDGLFSSEHTRLYTSMYDQQIAQQMTAGKGLGLAEMMVKQMTPASRMLFNIICTTTIARGVHASSTDKIPARNRGALSKSDAFAAGAKGRTT
ncbi:hypothetical protein EIMP300_61560 [Escherichia coli]|uniref:Flagellar protein FlgJ N-terminal domain-containing protein n=1 Tax=Escherichia coli TaxID=562 RepID=A0A8S0FX76_ECOLX|nr:hypothetical protein EIMP300_61560 [Escherichia coli]